MEYSVLLIYLVLAMEFWPKNGASDTYQPYGGHHTRFGQGMANVFCGAIGMFLIDMFLRDKGILPSWVVWTAFVGFAIMMLSGLALVALGLFSRE